MSCAACGAKLVDIPAGGLPLVRVVRIGLNGAEALASEHASPAELRDFSRQLAELATGNTDPAVADVPDEGLRALIGKLRADPPASPESARDALRTLASVLPGGGAAAVDAHAEAARQLRLKRIAIAIAGGLILVVAIVVIAIAVQPAPPKPREAKTIPSELDTIGIEVRTKPRGMVTVGGHKIGMAPVTVHVKRSDTSIEVSADLMGHPITKTVIPNKDQTIDLTYP